MSARHVAMVCATVVVAVVIVLSAFTTLVQGNLFPRGNRVNDISWGDQVNPDVAVGTDGTIHVVWEDYSSGSPTDSEITYSRSVDGGRTFLPSVRVTDPGALGSGQKFPSVTVSENGWIHVVWTDLRFQGGPLDDAVFYARSTDGGQTFGPPVRFSDGTGTWGDGVGLIVPSIVYEGHGGDCYLHVVWSWWPHVFAAGQPPGTYGVRYDTSADCGTNWGFDTNIAPIAADAAISATTDGTVAAVAIAYIGFSPDASDVFLAFNDGSGWASVQVTDMTIPPGALDGDKDPSVFLQVDPMVSPTTYRANIAWADGRRINPNDPATWYDWEITYVLGQGFPYPFTFGPEVSVSQMDPSDRSEQSEPSVRADDFANPRVAWTDWRNDPDGHRSSPPGAENADVSYAESADAGTSFGVAQRVNDDDPLTSREQSRPALFEFTNVPGIWRGSMIVWQDEREGTLDIYSSGSDYDQDGLTELEEYRGAYDHFDGCSYVTDPYDLDTDGDGLPDGIEVGLADRDADPFTWTCPTDTDTDNDGLPDGWIDLNEDTEKQSGEFEDRDADGAKAGGLWNGGAGPGETDPRDPDTDDDGILDGEEALRGLDRFLTDPLDQDTDDDRIHDGVEAGVPGYDPSPSETTNPTSTDTDGDGLPDGWIDCGSGPSGCLFSPDEPGYDPVANPDPDGDDGTSEGNGIVNLRESEDANWNGQTDSTETSAARADSDADGLPDGLEQGLPATSLPPDAYVLGLARRDDDPATTTDPLDADSDDDGLLDGTEDPNQDGQRDPSETDPLVRDSDGDRLTDGQEVGRGWPEGYSSLADWQADGDSDTAGGPNGFVADSDPVTQTDPLAQDTDGDTLPDGWVDLNQDAVVGLGEFEDRDLDGLKESGTWTGQAGTGETDPNVPDTDQDALSDDLEELVHGTNPIAWDTEGDGMPDGWELTYDSVLDPFVNDAGGNTDGDQLLNLGEYQANANPTLPDTDLDFIFDHADVRPTTYDVDPDALTHDDVWAPSPTEFLPEDIVINDALGVEVAVDYAWSPPDVTITITAGSDTFGTGLVGSVVHITIVPQGGATLPSYRAVVKVKFGANPVDGGGNPVDPKFLLMYGWMGDDLGEWVLMKHSSVGEETWRNLASRFVWGFTTVLGDVAIADTTQRDFDGDGFSDGAEHDVAESQARIAKLCDSNDPPTCLDPNHERASWIAFGQSGGDVTYYLRVPVAEGAREGVVDEGSTGPRLTLTTDAAAEWEGSSDSYVSGDTIPMEKLDLYGVPVAVLETVHLTKVDIPVDISSDHNWEWRIQIRQAENCNTDGSSIGPPKDSYVGSAGPVYGTYPGEQWLTFNFGSPVKLEAGKCYYLVVQVYYNTDDTVGWLKTCDFGDFGKWAKADWTTDPGWTSWYFIEGVIPAFRFHVKRIPHDISINVVTWDDSCCEWTQSGYVNPSAGIPFDAQSGLTVNLFSDAGPAFDQVLDNCTPDCLDVNGYLFIPLRFHSSTPGNLRIDGLNVFVRGKTGQDALSDTDEDGLSDDLEDAWAARPIAACMSSTNPDSDGDGLLDGADPLWWRDPDGDGDANACDVDSDGDGLWDGWHDTGNQVWDDTEQLGEWNYGSDPLLTDTDADGLWDGWDDANDDGICNDALPGSRGEVGCGSIGTPSSYGHGTDPVLEDTDGDILADLEELTDGEDGVRTDPLDEDSDGDRLLDGLETLGWYTELLTSAEAICNVVAILYGAETCGDVNLDSQPVPMTDGRTAQAIAPYFTRDHVTSDPNDLDGDTDGDGLDDFDEFQNRTNPQNIDSDGDGLLDGDADDPNDNNDRFEDEPAIVELIKPFIDLTWVERVFAGDCGIAIKCVEVTIRVKDNAVLDKLIIVLDGKVDRETDLTGVVSTTLTYEFGIGLLDAFTGKTVNFIIIDANGNFDEAWLTQKTIGDAVMDIIKDATVRFLGPEKGGLLAGLWDFFWGMFVGPAALIENAGDLFAKSTVFAQEILNSSDILGKFAGLFGVLWDGLIAQADAANPYGPEGCGDSAWDFNCPREVFALYYWIGNGIGLILTIVTGASVTHAIRAANLGGKIATVLGRFPTMARAVQFASNVYQYLGRFTVRAALAAAAFALSYELAELFGGFFDWLFVTGFGAAAVLMMVRMNMDFFGFSPGDLFDSSTQSAFRGAMRARATLSPDEVGRLATYSDAVQSAVLRSIDQDLLDIAPGFPHLGLRPGVLDGWAAYLKDFSEVRGGNLDQLLNDINLYRAKPGAARAFNDLQDQLASSRPRALQNVDYTLAEWRAVVRGNGHRFGDITHVSQKFDASGNPVDSGPYLAWLDGKLANGDIVEVKSTKRWSELRGWIHGDGGQIARQRQLLQIWGGNEIRVYIDGSLMTKAQNYLTKNGITDVKLYLIPGT